MRPRCLLATARLALCLSLGASGTARAADELVLVVGGWCPYECTAEEADGLRGFVTDIAVAVLTRSGAQVSLVTASYLRGIALVRENQAQVLVGIPREDAPDLIYPEIEQALSANAFYVRAGDPWRYTGAASLDALDKIGLLEGVQYTGIETALAAHRERIEMIGGHHNARRNLLKLLAGHLSAIVEDPVMTQFALHRIGKVGALVEAGTLPGAQPRYVAFSPQLPQAAHYAEQMTRGMRELRASGELAAILARYGLRDWQAAPPR